MKKTLGLLSILLVLLVALAGCGSTGADTEKTEAAADATQVEEGMTEDTSEGYLLFINTEGLGQIAYAKEGEELAFSDDEPLQSGQVTVAPSEKLTLGAKPDEEWKFIKWTVNGEDYSEEEQITITATDDLNITAYFDVE